VSSVLPIALMALAGVLLGGAWSMYRQGASRGSVGLLAGLAVVALVGAVLWLVPGDG
jgi:hypothetical protein